LAEKFHHLVWSENISIGPRRGRIRRGIIHLSVRLVSGTTM
jgi:hypothetical protein